MAKAKARAKTKVQPKKKLTKPIAKKAKASQASRKKSAVPQKKKSATKKQTSTGGKKSSALKGSNQKKASLAVVRKAQALSPSASTQKVVDVTDFVTPLDDRMIVQIKAVEKRTTGGLYIPDTVSSVSGHREGLVLSVGRGHRDPKGRLRPMDVKKGDRVLFSEYAGSKLDYAGQELVILRETDVMGVVD